MCSSMSGRVAFDIEVGNWQPKLVMCYDPQVDRSNLARISHKFHAAAAQRAMHTAYPSFLCARPVGLFDAFVKGCSWFPGPSLARV
jgi:hypothetical protein